MWLVVGLGNPGVQYALTRHNIGFMALDLLAQGLGNPPWREEHRALTCKLKLDDTPVLFAKPMTYMNKSGESVQALLNFYKISVENLIVIHDEVDFPFAQMKIHKNRSAGGNNGIKSISEILGTQDYTRLRLGIGRPPHPEMQVADYVLQKFSAEEQSALPEFLNKAGDAVEALIFDGLSKASTKFN
jgi:PTH1 family peptidyl-tRNA hydrolase